MATLKSLVDETTNIKDELKTCHSNLSTALIDKGVEVLSDDKMLELINKIDDISVSSLGGKRWATGSVPGISSNTVSYSLDFSPSLVLVIIGVFSFTSGYVYNYKNVGVTNLVATVLDSFHNYLYNKNLLIKNITNSGFYIQVSDFDSYTMSNITWYAFE